MAGVISAGKVSLDLILNSKEFKTQLNTSVNDSIKSVSASTSKKIKSTFSSMGKIAAAAFSVKAITNFTKSCLDLGSTLQEVQNVVDVTFGSMASDANKFAQSAIKNFGLSETVAKQYMGTYGAMAKSFGYSTKEALELSESLTGLVGDVSSFYNLDSSESYTKLKSVFTGETESLKDLGVVMTQTALDNYALANGFGKTTKQMTEQEKVSLRYKFVLDKLSSATGDFIRTQDGWANQTRVLSLQWDSFKANLGQGFITALTPAINLVNRLMEKLVQLSSVFKSTMEGIFGKQDSGSISSISSEMAGLAGNTENVGTAAENAAKKIRRSLMHFDKLNILSSNDTSSSGISSSTSSTTNENTGLEGTEEKISPLASKIKEIQELISQGFKDGLGNSSLAKTREYIDGIKNQINNIANDPTVKSSSENLINSVLVNLGRVTGSAGSIGITVSENLTGGIEKNLQEKSPRIKDYIAKMFDIGAERAEIKGQLAATIADIFSVFRSDDAQSLTSNILGSIEEFTMSISLLGNRIGLEIQKFVTQPIIDNKEEIKSALNALIEVANEFATGFNDGFTHIGDTIDTVYTEKIGPALQKIRDLFSEIFNKIVSEWNENIYPVLTELGEKFNVLVEEHIKPFADTCLRCFGDVFELLSILFDFIKPVLDWFINTMAPILKDAIDTIGNAVMDAIAFILDTLKNFMTYLSGFINFIIGVFTLDWKRAWEGIKTSFKGIIDGIVDIVRGSCKIIGGLFDGILDTISNVMNGVIDGINRIIGKVKGTKIGGAKIEVETPDIPKLAQGGYVSANTPRLAMIGDNTREGEIVAPESKIREQVIIAMQPLLTAIQQLIAVIQNGGSVGSGEISIPIYLGNELLDTYIINLQNRQVLRTGGR